MKIKSKIFFILAICLSISKIALSNTLATEGSKMNLYENQMGKINQENDYLKKEIAQLSSLNLISKKAEEMGLSNSGYLVNLAVEIPLALR